MEKTEVTIFWSWNGEMKSEEIERQLELFQDQGITGVFLHSRAGLKLHYLENDWFNAVEVAIKKAEKIGMDIYFYDEDGWPSGFAGGAVVKVNPEFKSMKVKIENHEPINGKILFKYKKENDKYILTDGDASLYVNGYLSQYYVDLLNPVCVDTFISLTHEKYRSYFSKYFGNVVKGIYTDEPQLMAPYVYNKYIDDYYLNKYHEDIKEKYYLLESDSFEACEFRIRYFEVISYLFTEFYTKKIASWCDKNNLKLTGHFACEDGLCTFRHNGLIMNHYINYQIPGIDFLGKRITSPVLTKQLESIKNQFEKSKVLSESLGCTGWNTSFKEFRYLWGYQTAFGINMICSHLGAYSIEGIRKRDYPAFFSYQEPWFNDYNILTKSFSNMSSFVSEGISLNDTLVISPLLSITSRKYMDILSKKISTEYRNLLSNLLDLQIYFELADELTIKEYASIKEDIISIGKSSYKYLIVSETEIILKETLQFIRKCRKFNIHVLFINDFPKYYYDCGNIYKIDEDFNEYILINNRKELLNKYFDFVSYKRDLEIRSGFSNNLTSGLVINKRLVNDEYHYFIVNKSDYESKQVKLKFKYNEAIISTNIEKNEYKTLNLVDNSVDINLKPMESIFIKNIDRSPTKKKDDKLICEKVLCFKEARLMNKNIFTIDNASFRFDNKIFSELLPVIKIQDIIFKDSGKILEVKYMFYSCHEFTDIELGIEDVNISRIIFDGIELSKPCGFFLDKSIKTYKLGFFDKGNHEIICTYLMDNTEILNTKNIFETERNRFSYPIVIENIYLIGDFSVKTLSTLKSDNNCYHVCSGDFCLDLPSKINANEEISRQNAFFYNGSVLYETDYYHQKGKKELKISSFSGVFCKVYINDLFVGNIIDYETIDITDYLLVGINKISLILICSNRNTLGPHHHKNGEVNLTGVHTFTGEYDFEDQIFEFKKNDSTWVDSYSFVEFKIDKIIINEYE